MAVHTNTGATKVEEAQQQKEVTINAVDEALDLFEGVHSEAISNGTNTLTVTEGRAGLVILTGSLSASAIVEIPSTLSKRVWFLNSTTGGQTVQARYGSGGTLRTLANGVLTLMHTGGIVEASAGVPRALLNAYTPLVTGNFTWINQGSATVTVINNVGHFRQTGHASPSNISIFKKSAPSPPYTVTVAIVPNFANKNFHQFGLCWRDNAGLLHTLSIRPNAGNLALFSTKWNSPTSLSADYTNALGATSITLLDCCAPLYLRIADDNTNRIVSYSHDGEFFQAFHTVSRTDFLTPTEVGIVIDAENSATPNWDVAADVLSYKEA